MEEMQVVQETTNNFDNQNSFIKNLILNIDSNDLNTAYESANIIKNKIIGNDRKKQVILHLSVVPHLIKVLSQSAKSFEIKNEILYILTSLAKLNDSVDFYIELKKHFNKENQKIIIKNLINHKFIMESSLVCLNALCNNNLLIFEAFFEEPLPLNLYQIFLGITNFKQFEYLTNILAHIPPKTLDIYKDRLITHNLLDYLSSKLATLNISEKIKENILEFYVKITSIPSLPITFWAFILKDDYISSRGNKTHKLLQLFESLQSATEPYKMQFLAAKCVLNIYQNLIRSFGKTHADHICQFEKLLSHAEIQVQHSIPSIDLLILKRTLPTFTRLLSLYRDPLNRYNTQKSVARNEDGGTTPVMNPEQFELMVASANSLATLAETHPDLQDIACYTYQLLNVVNDILNPKSNIDLGINPDSRKGKILRSGIFKLCAVLCGNHESTRKRLIDGPYNLMDHVTKSILDNPNIPPSAVRDLEMENFKYNGILCLLSFSRSIQLLRTNFLDPALWHWMVDSIKLYHSKTVVMTASIKKNQESEYCGYSNPEELLFESSFRLLNALISLSANLLLVFSPAKENLCNQTNLVEILCHIVKDKTFGVDTEDIPFTSVRNNALWALMNFSYKSDKSLKCELCTHLPFTGVMRPLLDCLFSTRPNHPDVPAAVKVLGILRNLCAGGKSHLNTVLSHLDSDCLLDLLSYIINTPLNPRAWARAHAQLSGSGLMGRDDSLPDLASLPKFPNLTPYHKELAICVLIGITFGGDLLFDEAGDFPSIGPTGAGNGDKSRYPTVVTGTKMSSNNNSLMAKGSYTSPKDNTAAIYNEDELIIASCNKNKFVNAAPILTFQPSTNTFGFSSNTSAATHLPPNTNNIERLLMSGGLVPSTPLEGLAYSILHPSLANLAQHLPAMSNMRFMNDVMFMNSLVSSSSAASSSSSAVGSHFHPRGGGGAIQSTTPFGVPTLPLNSISVLPPPANFPLAGCASYQLPMPTSASSYLSPTNILRNFLTTKLRYNMALREDILRGLVSCLFEFSTQNSNQSESDEYDDNSITSGEENRRIERDRGISSSLKKGKGFNENDHDTNMESDTFEAMDLRKTVIHQPLSHPTSLRSTYMMGQPVIDTPIIQHTTSITGFDGPSVTNINDPPGTGGGCGSQENSNMDGISINLADDEDGEEGEEEEEEIGEEGEVIEEPDEEFMPMTRGNTDSNDGLLGSSESSKTPSSMITNKESTATHSSETYNKSDEMTEFTSGVSYTVSILAQLNKTSSLADTSTNKSTTQLPPTSGSARLERCQTQEKEDSKGSNQDGTDNNCMKSLPLNSLQRSAIRCFYLIYGARNVSRIDGISDYIPFPLNTLTREYTLSTGANAEEACANGRVSIKAFYWRILYNVLKSMPKFVLQDFYYNNTTIAGGQESYQPQNSLHSENYKAYTSSKDKFLVLKSFIKMLKRQSNIVYQPPKRETTTAGFTDEMESYVIDKPNVTDQARGVISCEDSKTKRAPPSLSQIKILKTNDKLAPRRPSQEIPDGNVRHQGNREESKGIIKPDTITSNRQPMNDILIDTNRENVRNLIPAFVNWLKEESKNNKRRVNANNKSSN